MEFIREIQRLEENKVTIDLPEDFKDHEVEILVLSLKEIAKDKSSKSVPFRSLDEISIDTRKFKFDREELHER